MKTFLLSAFLLLCLLSYTQLPQTYLKKKQFLELGNTSRTAELVVIIQNEKNTDDAALITAVKEQWTLGQVKYMSELEFYDRMKSRQLDPSRFYLFNNFKRDYYSAVPRPKVQMSQRTLERIPT